CRAEQPWLKPPRQDTYPRRYLARGTVSRADRVSPASGQQSQSGNLIQEAGQLGATAGLLELADRLGFDLADTLAGHLENVAHFFQRVAVAVAQTVPQADDFPLAIAEGLEDLVDAAAEHFVSRTVGRAFGAAIGQQVAKVAVLAVADRTVEADRIPAHRQHAAGFVHRATGLLSGFLNRRFAAQSLQQLPRHVAYLGHGLDHVHRDADGAALVGHGPGD